MDLILRASSVLLLCACIATNDRADQGRGTETCRVWQDAACDHFADDCGAVDRTTCDQQYQSITCRSDSIAQSCTDMLRSVRCGGASPDCLIGGVANPEPAQQACEEMVNDFCERSTACGISLDKQGCVDSAAVPCDRAVGYQLHFEQCLEDLAEIDCSAVRLPDSCASVIVARD